jgi:hypothetical protein
MGWTMFQPRREQWTRQRYQRAPTERLRSRPQLENGALFMTRRLRSPSLIPSPRWPTGTGRTLHQDDRSMRMVTLTNATVPSNAPAGAVKACGITRCPRSTSNVPSWPSVVVGRRQRGCLKNCVFETSRQSEQRLRRLPYPIGGHIMRLQVDIRPKCDHRKVICKPC